MNKTIITAALTGAITPSGYDIPATPERIAEEAYAAWKLGAAVVSCRRGGAATAFDQLNKYFAITQMPVVSSQYWNMVHGNTPEEVRLRLRGCIICVRGSGLYCTAYHTGTADIDGRIISVSFGDGEDDKC